MFGHPGFWTAPFLPEAEWKDHRDWVTEHLIEERVQAHIDQAYERWEAILTGYPDRVLCGFDVGRQWHFYEPHFDLHERFYRGLLGRLPEADARKIAFVNALRL